MTIGLGSLLLFLASIAIASTSREFDNRYPSCFLDRLQYCKDVQGLAGTFQCLDKKLDQLSPACRASLEKSPAFQCSLDALLLCPLVDDHYDLMSCLWYHRDKSLSSRCIGSGSRQLDFESGGKFHKCSKDRKKFCYGMHGFPRVMACLADHQNDLSNECKSAVGDCPAFRCAHDAEHYCPNAKSHHDVLKCIWAHKGDVSEDCKQVLSPPSSPWLSHHEHERHHGKQDRGKHHGKHHRHEHERHHGKHHGHGHKGHHGHEHEHGGHHGHEHEHGGHHGHEHGGHHGHEHEHGGHHGKDRGKHHNEHHKHHHEGHLPELKTHGKEHHGHLNKHHHRHRHHEHRRHFRACKFDVRRFCYDVDGFVDKMACLAHHEDELSNSCHFVLKHCPAFHCAEDVQKFCPGTKSKHEFVECLWEHRHELSDKCWNQDQDGDNHNHHMHANDKCRHEREQFCPKEQKESPTHDIECLGSHDKTGLSEQCRMSLEMRLACKDEVKKFCSSDDSYPLKCLKQHEEELNSTCKAALPQHQLMVMSKMDSALCYSNRTTFAR